MIPWLPDPGTGLFGREAVWAPTGREAADFDAHSIRDRGVPERTLMENAGRSAALLLDELHPTGPAVALVGSGNNGGDALVLLRNLRAWGRPVRALAVGKRGADDALLHDWPVPVEAWPGDADAGAAALLAEAGVLVDGLLGTGLGGPPRGAYHQAICALNDAPRPVLSLDVPSGVDADTGAVPGEAVRAEATVAFGWPKLGTVLHPGRSLAGRLMAVEIGFPPPEEGTFGARLITPEWAETHRPRRVPVTHKNRVGSLLLLAGRRGMAGAAVLAARSALRAGVGLLRVASHPENRTTLQGAVPEAVYVDPTDPEALAEACGASRAMAAGPGWGTEAEAAEILEAALEACGDRPVLLDADALNLVAEGRVSPPQRRDDAGPVLLTPHPGEMARLLGESTPGDVAADPLGVARAHARDSGATVLLKGTPSLVARPDGSTLVECVSSSDLAAGGMGDILTGAAASFLAQGADSAAAAGLGLHYTGLAARRAGKGAALVPSDVVERIPESLEWEQATGVPPFLLFHQEAPW